MKLCWENSYRDMQNVWKFYGNNDLSQLHISELSEIFQTRMSWPWKTIRGVTSIQLLEIQKQLQNSWMLVRDCWMAINWTKDHLHVMQEKMCKICPTQFQGLAKGANRHDFWRLHPDLVGNSQSLDSPTLILANFLLFHKRKTPQRKKIPGCRGHQEECKHWIKCSFFESL